jgi:myo-inositol 2-dehydrogenase/D-chiro-inositol 1-dehydrogenase
MDDTVRIALIGAGRIARVHANAYKTVSGGKLVACADVILPSAQALGEDFGLDVHQDYNEMLARPDIDAVIIATPNGLHAEQMLAAARAGKHVFCQKPIALTLEDADRMIAVAEETGIIFQVGFMLRFTPPLPHVKELIDSGALGEVIAIQGSIFGWEPSNEWFYIKEQGGGVILDTMIHFADMIRWLAGDVKQVYADGGAYVLGGAKKHHSPDNASVMLRHAGGAVSNLYVTWTSGYGNFFFEVYGTKGSVSVNLLEKQVSSVFLKSAAGSTPAGWSYPDLVWPYGYAGEQQYFVDQIHGAAQPGQATGADGRAALEIVLRAQEALDAQRLVAVDGVKEG